MNEGATGMAQEGRCGKSPAVQLRERSEDLVFHDDGIEFNNRRRTMCKSVTDAGLDDGLYSGARPPSVIVGCSRGRRKNELEGKGVALGST